SRRWESDGGRRAKAAVVGAAPLAVSARFSQQFAPFSFVVFLAVLCVSCCVRLRVRVRGCGGRVEGLRSLLARGAEQRSAHWGHSTAARRGVHPGARR